MTVIHKQPLAHTVLQSFRPPGEVLKLLDVQYQDGIPCLWYEADPDFGSPAQIEIQIQCVGTGFPSPGSPWCYLSTTQVHNGQTGNLVWHWYGKRVYL